MRFDVRQRQAHLFERLSTLGEKLLLGAANGVFTRCQRACLALCGGFALGGLLLKEPFPLVEFLAAAHESGFFFCALVAQILLCQLLVALRRG